MRNPLCIRLQDMGLTYLWASKMLAVVDQPFESTVYMTIAYKLFATSRAVHAKGLCK